MHRTRELGRWRLSHSTCWLLLLQQQEQPHPKSTSKQGNLEDPVTPKSYVRLELYLKYLLPCRPTQSRSSCTLVEFALCLLMAACTDLAANPRSLDPSSPAVKIATTLHNMLPKKKGWWTWGNMLPTVHSDIKLGDFVRWKHPYLAFVALRHMCPQSASYVVQAGDSPSSSPVFARRL